MSWLPTLAYAPLPRANGILTPPMIATRRALVPTNMQHLLSAPAASITPRRLESAALPGLSPEAARYNRSRLRFLLAGLAAATLLACSQQPVPPPAARVQSVPAAEQRARLVERYWDESQRLNPHSRSALVRFEPAAGYDIAPQFLADSLDLERRYRDALLAVPRGALDAESQLTFDIFKRERDVAIEGYTYPSELMPVNPFRSVPFEFALAGAGVGSYAILSSKDYESWQARAADYVRWTAQAIANMREGQRRGYVLPRVLVVRLLPMLAALGADTPANVFYRPLGAIPSTLRTEERQRISDGINAAVKQDILPAYRDRKSTRLNS